MMAPLLALDLRAFLCPLEVDPRLAQGQHLLDLLSAELQTRKLLLQREAQQPSSP